jgi:excinuclease ABC subunit A
VKPITIRGCSVNNLKGISVSIPKNKLTVITGISGSGKSSLAFDVVYHEGRYAYLQAIGVIPDIQNTELYGDITGISPAVAVKQNIVRESNPRSLVGTRSSLFDHLRNLFMIEGRSENVNDLSTDDMNFNSLKGMCLECRGLGSVKDLSIAKVIPDPNVPLKQLCTELYTWTKKDGPQVFFSTLSCR